MKIDGNDYQIQKSASQLSKSELGADKNKKFEKIFNIFDKSGEKADGTLSKAEIDNALKTVEKWEQSKKADGELSDKEIAQIIKDNPELKGLSKKEVKEFIKTFLDLNSKKVEQEEAQEAKKAEEAKKAQEAKQAQEAEEASKPTEVKGKEAPEKSQESGKLQDGKKPEEPKTKTYDYVVPEGSTFKDLMKKVLLAQGKKEDELTDNDYANAEAQFKADNPNVKIRGDKTKYLLAGEKVKVSTNFEEELLDSKTEEAKWLARAGKSKGSSKTNKTDTSKKTDKTDKTAKTDKTDKSKKNYEVVKRNADGSEVRKYSDSPRRAVYHKQGYPTALYAENDKGGRYLICENAARDLGLRKTYGSRVFGGIYYDPKTKKHYIWDKKTQQFDAFPAKYKYCSPDGTMRTDTPQKIITDKKTGEITEIYEGGIKITYDKDGNQTSVS